MYSNYNNKCYNDYHFIPDLVIQQSQWETQDLQDWPEVDARKMGPTPL